MSQLESKFIDDGAVTDDKQANMPANTVKGNNSGIAAVPANLTVAQLMDMLIPAGTIWLQGMAALPPGNWLACDGSSLLRAGTYANLFAAIGTAFGAVDGTHFNLPPGGIWYRNIGTCTIGGINYTGVLGTIQGDQMQGHLHDFTNSIQYNAGAFAAGGAPGGNTLSQLTGSPADDTVNGVPRTGSETRPANTAVAYIIKF